MTCANEEANPLVSREYHLLRRLIDIDENFIEVRELGEDLAMNVRLICTIGISELNSFAMKICDGFLNLTSNLGYQKMDEYGMS